MLNHNIVYSGLSLDVFGCQNFRRYAAILDLTIVHKRMQLSKQKNVFLSVKIVKSVNEYKNIQSMMSYN